MNYRELIQFSPIEGGIRLGDANQREAAQRLVATYVISAGIAERLTSQVFPGLRCDPPTGTKSLLVTGHHGIGKSHLLAFVSCLAEHANLAAAVANPSALKVDTAAGAQGCAGLAAIAGCFQMVRIELAHLHLPLRDVLLGQIEKSLVAAGVNYSFPRSSQSHVDQAAFAAMMAAFHQKFPELGLLVVVDDLDEFLGVKGKRALYLDLHFLGEVAEVGQRLKFRLIAGAQENLFDSPRFKVAGEILERVKERFRQVPITSRDAQFTVAERLARKTPAQKALVESHLKSFAGLYGAMPGRMAEFVASFPIHPDCLDTLARIPFARQVELLRTLSDAVKQRLDEPVPSDEPGLIAYDRLWPALRDHPSLQGLPELEAVAERSKDLEKKLAGLFSRPEQQPLARRLVHGLCVQRLTTEDIYTNTGVTPAELRDQLCPQLPGLVLAGKPAESALAEVASVLDRLQEADGGQLVSCNPANRQYGLCFKKFRRFVRPELLLHWVNAVPFVILMLTGGIMAVARFRHVDPAWLSVTVLIHKIFAISWVVGLPLVVWLRPKIHWLHIREMLRWSKNDLIWMVQAFRGLYKRNAIMSPVGRFNTGQKINACLVMLYFAGFGLTGLSMLLQGTVLFPWYVHTSLFFATLGSVGGHLFLSLINPSTRIALAGIFHGWSPMEYVEHHHALSLPSSHHAQDESVNLKTIMEEVFVSKVELVVLALVFIMAGVGIFAFGQGRLASAKNQFARSFANAITPRELSTKHRIGEVTESCTKCHDYTGTIPDAKCIQCHQVIKERLARAAGYHGTLKGECIHCHKEHLPAAQSIVIFDREKFDHNLASFRLEEKHVKVACDDCHKKNRTKDMPGNYYVGLRYDTCTGCHRDLHQGQFAAACDQCHTARGWTGTELQFAHDADSTYALVAKHQTVACNKCHKPEEPGGALGTAQFKGLSKDCVPCHEDPHRMQFAGACTTCHSPAGWERKYVTFDHDRDTKFPLNGKHAREGCAKCHKPFGRGEKLASATFRGLNGECGSCHRDPHKGQLEGACTKCHTPLGWRNKVPTFDHNRDSKYPLEAKHAEVACAKCHVPQPGRRLGTAPFRGLKMECADCHKDPHKGQFVEACKKCHTPAGWTKKAVTFDHNKDSKYELEAKHAELACEKCHVPELPDNKLASAQFRNLKAECADCHKDPHGSQFARACTQCHVTSVAFSVRELRFVHGKDSTYPLTGRHLAVDCVKCHKPMVALGKLASGSFKGLGTDCDSCHKVKHPDTYGPTCASCHNNLDRWIKKDPGVEHITKYEFDREQLSGKHLLVECKSCHNPAMIPALGQFDQPQNKCNDCHKKDDPHKATLGTDCAKCHTNGGWKGEFLRFNHDTMTRYPLDRDHKNVACAKCHVDNQWKPLKSTCRDCHPNKY